ncbi:MAG: MFS transporter [Acidimicrobiia bacterium]
MSTAPPANHSMLRAFRYPKFTATFAAGFVSQLGDWMQIFARSVLAYQLTGKAESVGIIYFASYVPQLLFSVWGGVLADRFDRRKLFVGTQVAEAAGAAGIGVLVATGTVNVFNLAVLSFLIGIAFMLAIPAGSALAPAVVPPEALTSAISWSTATNSICRVLGPLLAAGAVAAFGGTQWVFWINTLSFAGVIAVWLVIKIPTTSGAPHESTLDAMRTGINYVRTTPAVATPIGMSAFLNTVGVVYQPLSVVFATVVLAAGDEELGVTRNGWLQASIGLGAAIGILALARLGERRPAFTFIGSAIMFSILLTLFGLASGLWVVLGIAFVAGAFQFANITMSVNLVQHRVPEALRGRVMSIEMLAMIGGVPIAALVGGWLADAVGVRVVISVAGLLCLAFSLVSLRWAKHIGNAPITGLDSESVAAVGTIIDDEG